VADSNLGLHIGYNGWGVSWYFPVRRTKFRTDILIKSWLLPSTSSPIQQHRIILATDSVINWTTKQSYGFGGKELYWIVPAILFVLNNIWVKFWSSSLRCERVTLVCELQMSKEGVSTRCMNSIRDIDFYGNWKERLNSNSIQLNAPPTPSRVDIASSLPAIPSANLFALCICCSNICCILLLDALLWQTDSSPACLPLNLSYHKEMASYYFFKFILAH
jgi:hypothetical protein